MAQVVTVFGGSGFVGKQVVRALARQGWRIRGAVRTPVNAYVLKANGDVGQIQVVRCDVRRDGDVTAALNGATACVNLVGIRHQTMGTSFDALHRAAATRIAEICAAKGIRDFVQVSALGADPKAPSQYSSSKAKGEEGVRKAIAQAVILRPSLIFGPQDSFITHLAGQVKSFPFMPAIGGAKTKFQPVYVGDVAAAVARVLGNTAAYGQTYELGGPEVYSFGDLIKYVGREVMAPRPLVYLPTLGARVIGVVGDIAGGLGFPPLLTTDQVLMLKRDYVAQGKGLKDLGIAPTALESIAPGYLWRFRTNGQFAVPVSADV
jgi:NADH dehydrogenase